MLTAPFESETARTRLRQTLLIVALFVMAWLLPSLTEPTASAPLRADRDAAKKVVGAALLKQSIARWQGHGAKPPTAQDVRSSVHHPVPISKTKTDALVAVANRTVVRLEGNCTQAFCRTTLAELQACASSGALADATAVVFRLNGADEPLCTARGRCKAPVLSFVRGADDYDLLVPTGATRNAESDEVNAALPWDQRVPTALWRGGLYCPRSGCRYPAALCGGHPLGGGASPFNSSATPYLCARTALARLSSEHAAASESASAASTASLHVLDAGMAPTVARAPPPLLDVAMAPGVTTRGQPVSRKLCSAGWTLAVRCHGADPAFAGLRSDQALEQAHAHAQEAAASSGRGGGAGAASRTAAPPSTSARVAGGAGAGAGGGGGFVPKQRHSAYRYLLHLDGHTYSNRIGWLLFTGSAVLKQASPWLQWYTADLLPGVHVEPFWLESADDVLAAVARLRSDDARARAIGAAGLAFARRSLSRAARCAHWDRVLRGYGTLFEPAEAAELARWARSAVARRQPFE